MADTSYDRAIAAFESLLLPVQSGQFSTPATLVRASGLPTSTGYRHMTTLEGNGLLTRGKNGVYVIGPTALRIGLSAFGVGQLAVLTPPILLRLREAIGRTAFLAVRQSEALHICAFSSGRAAAPAKSYGLPQSNYAALADVQDAFLADSNTDPARLYRAMLCGVPGADPAYLGVFTGPASDDDATLAAQLKQTAALFRERAEESK